MFFQLLPLTTGYCAHCFSMLLPVMLTSSLEDRILTLILEIRRLQLQELKVTYKNPCNSTGRPARCCVTTWRDGIGRVGGRRKREGIWGDIYIHV